MTSGHPRLPGAKQAATGRAFSNPTDSSTRPLWLSQETGQTVLAADGSLVGHVVDLSVRLDGHTGPRFVSRIMVQRRRAPAFLLPWTVIVDLGHSTVVLSDGFDPATHSAAHALADDEILLVRDVLDTQIVDVVGRRLARVADVVLVRTAYAHLELVGVEVGFGGVLRRLGLTRVATHMADDVVAWAELHLTSERGHTVQLNTPLSAVHHLDESGLAALVDRLDTESAAEVLAITDPVVAAHVVNAADPLVGERVLRAMADDDVADIVGAMPAEHAGRWRAQLGRAPAFLGRRFLRSQVWPRRRHRVRHAR